MDCQKRVGFSVIELIAVLTLIGILLAIGIPASNKLLLSYQLNGSARRVQTEIQNIKMRAAAENLGFQFAYSAGSGSYTIRKKADANRLWSAPPAGFGCAILPVAARIADVAAIPCTKSERWRIHV